MNSLPQPMDPPPAPEKLPHTDRHPWAGADFITPLLLFLPVAGLASVFGTRAGILALPGASLAEHAHLLMLGAWLLLPALLSVGPLARWRHRIATGAAVLCVAFPPCLVSLGSVAIPLSRPLPHEEWSALHDTFGIPILFTSDSSEGDCLRVRRSDDGQTLRDHLASLGLLQTGPTAPQ